MFGSQVYKSQKDHVQVPLVPGATWKAGSVLDVSGAGKPKNEPRCVTDRDGPCQEDGPRSAARVMVQSPRRPCLSWVDNGDADWALQGLRTAP